MTKIKTTLGRQSIDELYRVCEKHNTTLADLVKQYPLDTPIEIEINRDGQMVDFKILKENKNE